MNPQTSIKGVAFMVASCVMFCAMCALVKLVPNIDSYKTTLFRFIIGMGVLGTAALFSKINLKFVSGRLLFIRGFFGGASVYLFFLSISKLGMAKGTVFSYSSVLFASLFSWLYFREKMSLAKWLAIPVAMVGMYFLAVDDPAKGFSFSTFGKYELLAILGAIFSGVVVISIKQLHDTDSTYAIFFSQCVIGLWIVIVPANVVPCSIGYNGGLVLLGIGISATVGQLLMTEGYRHTQVTAGTLMGMLTPILNILAGALIFHETLSLRAILGSLIILASCIVVIRAES